jgi:cytochrome P450
MAHRSSPAVDAAHTPAVVDLAHPEFSQDQHAAWAAARERGSTFVAKPFHASGFLDHEDVAALLGDDRLGSGSGGTRTLDAVGITSAPFSEWTSHSIVTANPPRHTRLRGLLNKAFTPRRAERMRPVAREIAEELVRELVARGEAEFVADFAQRLPIQVIARTIGVPRSDDRAFAGWIAALAPVFGIAISREAGERAARAAEELQAFCNELIDAKRKQPGDDLLTALIAAEAAGDRLSLPELRSIIVALLFAGHDTTRSLLASGMKLLIDHPEVFDAIGREPDLAEPAVEEMLRLEPPIYMTMRKAFASFEQRGVPIAEGDVVVLAVAAANRDPAVFPDPDAFDLHRQRSRILSFGQGRHFCVGNHLARLEAQEATRAICAGLRAPRLTIERAGWVPMAGVRSFEALPIRFDAA